MDTEARATSRFSEIEHAFLHDELADEPKLARLATVDTDGTPHVVPTGWRYNAEHDTLDFGGIALERTRKYRNVARTGRAAAVIDDVLAPWRPRAVMVKGAAEALDDLIRLHPDHVVSWGLSEARG